MAVLQLTPEQCAALDAAGSELDASRAALGQAYLRAEEARIAHEKAQIALQRQAARGRRAEADHAVLMQGLAQVLQLPPGKYTYDKAAACLRKDQPDE
jgi:hypothetical protein